MFIISIRAHTVSLSLIIIYTDKWQQFSCIPQVHRWSVCINAAPIFPVKIWKGEVQLSVTECL